MNNDAIDDGDLDDNDLDDDENNKNSIQIGNEVNNEDIVNIEDLDSYEEDSVDRENENESPPILNETEDITYDIVVDEDIENIKWNSPIYQMIWDQMNITTKTTLLTYTINNNNKWLLRIMSGCYKAKKENGVCEFVEPDDLIIPPLFLNNDKTYSFDEFSEKMINEFNINKKEISNYSLLFSIGKKMLPGENIVFEFGNDVYNNIFNNLNISHQDTLLSLYNISKGEQYNKQYSFFKNALNDLVAKEIKFTNFIFNKNKTPRFSP